MAKYGVVLVTVGSQAEAETIGSALVTAKLAACVNLFPLQSIYHWEGKICQDPEYQLVIKTDLQHFNALVSKVSELRRRHGEQRHRLRSAPERLGDHCGQ